MKPITDVFHPRLAAELASFSGFIASGDDVNGFLQGQLTNDVQALAVGMHQRTGYCTPKGRLLASMVQWRAGTHALGHLVAADIAQAAVKRLGMFVLRSKVRFSDMANEPMAVIGLWGAAASGIDWQDGKAFSLADASKDGAAEGGDQGPWLLADAPCPVMGDRAWLIAKAGDAQALLLQLAGIERIDEQAWQFSEIMAAKPWIRQATSESFVPQMINFEVIHGVSFSKGCYPGQEVVARTQYLGKLKRRMFRADVMAPSAAGLIAADLVGTDVWSEHHGHEPCGRVVSAALMRDQSGSAQPGMALLVECAMDAWESGGLHLHSTAGVPITQAALPYAFPAAA
jgi:folate-binding protein YgfZ